MKKFQEKIFKKTIPFVMAFGMTAMSCMTVPAFAGEVEAPAAESTAVTAEVQAATSDAQTPTDPTVQEPSAGTDTADESNTGNSGETTDQTSLIVTPYTPCVEKKVTGDEPSDPNTEFTIVLNAVPDYSYTADADGDQALTELPMPIGVTGTQSVTKTIKAGETIDFGNFIFTKPGTYIYQVVESAENKAEGYTYDPVVYYVMYYVYYSDATQTKLYCDTHYFTGEDSFENSILNDSLREYTNYDYLDTTALVFTNTYKAGSEAPAAVADNGAPAPAPMAKMGPAPKGKPAGQPASTDHPVQTGDSDQTLPLCVTLAVTAAALSAVLVSRKRHAV